MTAIGRGCVFLCVLKISFRAHRRGAGYIASASSDQRVGHRDSPSSQTIVTTFVTTMALFVGFRCCSKMLRVS